MKIYVGNEMQLKNPKKIKNWIFNEYFCYSQYFKNSKNREFPITC